MKRPSSIVRSAHRIRLCTGFNPSSMFGIARSRITYDAYSRKFVFTRRCNCRSICPGTNGRCTTSAGTSSACTCVSPFPFTPFAPTPFGAGTPLPPGDAPSTFSAGFIPRMGNSGCSDPSFRFAAICSYFKKFWVSSILYRHHEILHNVVLTFRRVLPHVKRQDILRLGLRRGLHLRQPHFFSNELLELARRNFSQPFEPRDLRRCP